MSALREAPLGLGVAVCVILLWNHSCCFPCPPVQAVTEQYTADVYLLPRVSTKHGCELLLYSSLLAGRTHQRFLQ